MEEKYGRAETEKQVDALMAEADRLLTTAERTPDPAGVYAYCRAAVRKLLFAYLLARGGGEDPSADLGVGLLWEKSVALDPEILPLADNVRLFLEEAASITGEEKAETMLDAANELWDYIFDLCFFGNE